MTNNLDLLFPPEETTDDFPAPPANRVEMLKEFKEAFEWAPSVELNKTLILEEAREVREALQHLLKEMADLEYVMIGAYVAGNAPEAFTQEVLDEVHRVEFLYQYVNPDIFEEVFKRVHLSNMSKLGEDGKPVRREDGKVLKGPNYKEPYLGDLG